MYSKQDMPQVRIIDADLTREGVIITFSDGQTTLFHADFLRSVVDQDGNIPLLKGRP